MKGKIIYTETLEITLAEYLLDKKDKNILLVSYNGFNKEKYISYNDILHLRFATKLLTFQVVEEFLIRLEKDMPHPEIIIAIGGGVVLDLAKMLRYALSKEDSHAQLVLIPSTAGTGSESTSFAVVYDDNKFKKTIDDPILLPDSIIHSPDLLLTLGRQFRISSGFDALAQSIESMWSRHSTDESKSYAIEAIKLIKENFVKYVDHQDMDAAKAMQKAAYLSGKAINISYTTLAHALSYSLTSKFGISHGLAVFLYIPDLVRYNSDIPIEELNELRGVKHVEKSLKEIQHIFGVHSNEDLAITLNSYFRVFNIPGRLSNYGITENDIDNIFFEADQTTRGQNNPRSLNKEKFKKLITSHF
jgi:alcohol dehydrogenase class IV